MLHITGSPVTVCSPRPGLAAQLPAQRPKDLLLTLYFDCMAMSCITSYEVQALHIQ